MLTSTSTKKEYAETIDRMNILLRDALSMLKKHTKKNGSSFDIDEAKVKLERAIEETEIDA